MLASKHQARRALAGALLFVSLVLASSGRVAAGEEPAGEIAWRHDYGPALQEAQSKHQLLWIQFTAPWCPNCARMEHDSFPHPAVQDQLKRSFVPVKLRSDLNEELALGFGLSGLPATVVLAPSREVLAVHQGYLGPEELAGVLDDARRRHKPYLAIDGVRSAPETKKQAEQSAARPKEETRLALSGYCPVSLVSEKRLVPGQAEYTAAHQGRLYRFASLITFNLFRRDPDRYVPSNGGNCPVAQLERQAREPGNPHFGVLFQGHLFLCATENDRRRFLQEPERFAAVDVVERGFCPHCLERDGLYVRGDPRIELNREGRRYWFPDSTHRQAFLAASESATRRR